MNEPGVFTLTETIDNGINCPEVCNGAVSVIALNGVAPVNYSLSGGTTQTTTFWNNLCGDLTYGFGQARSNTESILQDFTRIHSLGLDVVATRKLNAADTLKLSLSAPLRVESGAVTIKSPYDAERVNLSPSGRQVDVGVSFQHQIDSQRSVSAGITYINDYHHDRDVTHGRVMLNYWGRF